MNAAKVNAGGPAFPLPNCSWNDAGGMSLRDYFAGQAMAGMSRVGPWALIEDESIAPKFARAAYVLADAMLAERAK